MLLAVPSERLLSAIERSLGWQLKLDPAAVQTVLATLASSMFTFIVFVSSALLVAVQLASAQLTPRIIGFLFRDPVTKTAQGMFVFTFTFTLATLLQVGTNVPPLTMRVAAYGCLVNLGMFLFLIDHVGRALRANGALRSIGGFGRDVIETVYPRNSASSSLSPSPDQVLTTEPTQTINSHTDGAVLSFDASGLLDLACQYNCTIEIVPRVGDFVAAGDRLFNIFQGGAELPPRQLRHSIAIGSERTFDQDPTYALRIIVDIASKALSPAINDPTTAVLALNEIHHLLRSVGERQLDDRVLADADGKPRLAYHTPNWGDFVNLGVTEIRLYGAESIQVARRLLGLLEDLIRTLPEGRAEPLRQELMLLRRSAKRFFAEPEDQALAAVSDPQGVGGRNEDDAVPSTAEANHP